MSFIELAKERYSLRKFSNKQIEKEKLDLIIQAAQIAPTAANRQPQRILVIDSPEALLKFKKCTKYHFDAPMAFLVCYDKNTSWKRVYDQHDSGYEDASIITTHMMMEASELGLGTTWVGHFMPEVVVEEFNLPENIIPVAFLPIGYPAADASISPMHYQRKALEETVFYNEFDFK